MKEGYKNTVIYLFILIWYKYTATGLEIMVKYAVSQILNWNHLCSWLQQYMLQLFLY